MILVTGGAGYIGTHTCVELHNAGYDFIIYDNLSNSSQQAIKGVEKIINKKIKFIKGDIRDKETLEQVFQKNNINTVIHFAGLKAVGESMQKPLDYYDNNVNGTLVLLEVMKKNQCQKIIFSSSATVYGDPQKVPIQEDFPLHPTNPYGRTKLFIEEILKDLFNSDSNWKIIILRYFNPIGAHDSGLIGESPTGTPNNIMPFINQVAIGKQKQLNIFGNDYDTVDGTGVRDYIHVTDLSQGHVQALSKISNLNSVLTVNLGTGRGYSVFELIKAFEKASGKKIPYQIVARRPGDIAQCYTDSSLAKKTLNWQATKDINKMCQDSWNWQSKNPNGYLNNKN